MQDLLIKLIGELNSSVFILLAILILAFWAAYKVGGWKQLFHTHSGRIEKVERISDTVIAIQTKVDLIYQFANPNAPVKTFSPAALTQVGKDIVEKINAEDIFRRHAVRLIGLVEGKKPQNAYDIQQISFDVAKKEFMNLLNESELKLVKDEAFARGILVEDVLGVFAILLRNKILADKNIPIVEIDIHEQKSKQGNSIS